MNEDQPDAVHYAVDPTGVPESDAPTPDAPPDVDRWEPPEPTGVTAVDEALQPLASLDTLPTNAHVEHYETVHRRLQDALADLDGS